MKHAGHGYSHTTITHHADGSHTVKHHVHPDHAHEMKDKEYATGDHDGMIDGMMDHTSMPNPGEGAMAEPAAGGPPAPAAPAGA